MEPSFANIWSMLKSPQADNALAPWLRWHPSQINECVRARQAHLPRPLDADEMQALRQTHQTWGADGATLENIAALGRPNVRVIVTGQQPAPLGGPLLILYKALGAVRLARRLKKDFPDLHFVPVFWVASEDHDFDEIRRSYWTSNAGALEEWLVGSECWEAGQMIGPLATQDWTRSLCERIESSTHETEFRPAVLDLIRQVYAPGQTLESSFVRLLMSLLAGSGMVFISPLMPWVRARSVKILQQEIAAPGRSSGLIIERGKLLQQAGLTPGLHRSAEAVNAFWVDAASRRLPLRCGADGSIQAIEPSADAQQPAQTGKIFTAQQLLEALRQDPTSLSTNVVTRPLVQDSLLPTVAQMVGPGEAAYLAQVEAVYETFGVFAPVRYPRPQATLIEPRVERNLIKNGLSIEEALGKDEQALGTLLISRDHSQGPVQMVEATALRQLEELDGLCRQLGSKDPSVQGAFDKLHQMMSKGYKTIGERMLYQMQHDQRHLARNMFLVANSLHPTGQPQERLFNAFVPFAINYGLDWPARLLRDLSFNYDAPMQVIAFSKLTRPASVSK